MVSFFTAERLQNYARWLWGFALLTLPVTTFRYIPGLGRTLVKPLALYPLVPLVVILLFIFLQRRRIALPSNIKPLLAFLFVGIAFTFGGLLQAPLPMREFAFDERALRGWFSVLIGLLFFLVAFWMNRTKEDLSWSLKWIYAGLALTIIWSLIQAVAVNTSFIPRSWINQLQAFISTRPLQQRRISGFAYEPAWLADQLVIFFLPWLFAALLTGRRLTKRKWLEPAFFVLSLAVLVFTYSRSGLLTGLICIVLVTLLAGRSTLQAAWSWFVLPFRRSRQKNQSSRLIRVVLVIGVVVIGFASVNFLSDYEYFANIWQIAEADDPLDYLVDISAGPRLAYAVAGYRVYEGAPLTGVGMGASGLTLLQNFPEWSFNLPEIARQLSPDSDLIPNTKSLYVRLLAETGLPGFWLFVAFLLSFLAIIRHMFISDDRTLRFVAVAGLFAWLALVLRNLTQDSFTFPIMWVILGIIAGLSPYNPKEFRLGRTS
jgi:hypothetical protein